MRSSRALQIDGGNRYPTPRTTKGFKNIDTAEFDAQTVVDRKLPQLMHADSRLTAVVNSFSGGLDPCLWSTGK
jgi:hypothetical protein